MQNREGRNGIQKEENPDSNQPRPKFIAAKISVPRFFSGKARTVRRLFHLPMFKADADIPPSKWRKRQRIKQKVCLYPSRIRAKVEARFEHKEDCEHERDQAHHFSWPDADA